MKAVSPNRLLFSILAFVLVGCSSSGGDSAGGQDTTVAGIEVSPSEADVPVGGSQQFSAVARNAAGEQVGGVAFEWTSSAPSIAGIDASGRATGLASGSTEIRASVGTVTSPPATLRVGTCSTLPAASIQVTPDSAVIQSGQSQQFAAVVQDGNGVGVCSPPALAWASSDTTVATIDANGLAQGQNTGLTNITASGGGLTSNASDLTVTAGDATAPSVAITSPANLSLFNTGPITVNGTVDDPGAAVLVNGVAAASSGGTFTATGITLKEGVNIITASATDAAGNASTATIQVTLDTTPPTVVIESPSNGHVTPDATITIAGAVNDIVTGTVNGVDVAVTCAGSAASVQNRTFVVAGVALKKGLNSIQCRAVDAAGNARESLAIQVKRQDLVGQRIEAVSGNNQSAVVGVELPQPFVVRLVDAAGNPVSGRKVTFDVVRGSGTLRALNAVRSLQVVTNASGEASAAFTLGGRAGVGNHRVRAAAVGFAGAVEFCATALAGTPDKIIANGGENQRGQVGAPLPHPFMVLVVDKDGNALQNVPVTFTVTQGGGTINGLPAHTVNTDDDGRAVAVLTVGPEAGINNHVVEAAFPGLTRLPATFVASGVIPGNVSETAVSGVVLDNSNNPVPGVTARILGTALEAVTGDQGQFSMPGAPVGALVLEIDGTTTTRPGTWPVLHFNLTTISGQNNTLGMPIFILPIDTVNAKVAGGASDVTLQMADVPGLDLTVFANSVTCPDGSSQCQVMLTQVHMDKVPMPPPNGVVFAPAWTIQPAGTHFDPPARISIPNTSGLPPGGQAEIFQFDHDMEAFVSVGTGTVSPDGSVVTSDPGFGVTKAGWGGVAPPPPPTTEVENDPGKCLGLEVSLTNALARADLSISSPQVDESEFSNALVRGKRFFQASKELSFVAATCVLAAAPFPPGMISCSIPALSAFSSYMLALFPAAEITLHFNAWQQSLPLLDANLRTAEQVLARLLSDCPESTVTGGASTRISQIRTQRNSLTTKLENARIEVLAVDIFKVGENFLRTLIFKLNRLMQGPASEVIEEIITVAENLKEWASN